MGLFNLFKTDKQPTFKSKITDAQEIPILYVEGIKPISKDGYYDVSKISKKEHNQLIHLINHSKKYGCLSSLVLINNVFVQYLYRNRYYLEEIVIKKYQNSNSIFDVLAVGIAFSSKGSGFRKQAIDYIKNFINTATNEDWKKIQCVNSFKFTKSNIYNTLSELCEKEMMLNDAYEYALIAVQNSNQSTYDRIGEILKKIDINKCVKYYQTQLKKTKDKSRKKQIKEKLDDALKKQEKGYKYKPRKRKNNIDVEFETNLEKIAIKYLDI